VGNPKRPVYLPAEVCKIAKGQRRLKLDERQTAEMIKTAAKKPHERMAFIEKAVNEQAQFPNDPIIKAMGLKVEPKMMEVTYCTLHLSAHSICQ
jgi:eukaryotic translation initiation factor 2C